MKYECPRFVVIFVFSVSAKSFLNFTVLGFLLWKLIKSELPL